MHYAGSNFLTYEEGEQAQGPILHVVPVGDDVGEVGSDESVHTATRICQDLECGNCVYRLVKNCLKICIFSLIYFLILAI